MTGSRPFLVQPVKASEPERGDEIIIVEFRGRVESNMTGRDSRWIALEGGEGAELQPDAVVLRVVDSPSEAPLHNALLEIQSDWSDWNEADALKRVLQIADDALKGRPDHYMTAPSPSPSEAMIEAAYEKWNPKREGAAPSIAFAAGFRAALSVKGDDDGK